MAMEDVIAREARLVESTTPLDAKEKDISSQEEKLEATLNAKRRLTGSTHIAAYEGAGAQA